MKTELNLEIKTVWKVYLDKRLIEDRDYLIESYLFLVKQVVHKLIMGMPSHIKAADLYAVGVDGLVKAVEKYDPSKSKRFEGYAVFLIKAAIIDDLRKQDWVPRSAHQKAAKLSQTMDVLRQKLGKEPTSGEICQYLKISLNDLNDWYVSSRPALMLSLNEDRAIDSDGEYTVSLEEKIADNRALTGYDVADKNEYIQLLSGAIQALEYKERQVMVLYYYEGLMLKEIGKIFGVSESRVSQIHAKALLKLRVAFQAID